MINRWLGKYEQEFFGQKNSFKKKMESNGKNLNLTRKSVKYKQTNKHSTNSGLNFRYLIKL